MRLLVKSAGDISHNSHDARKLLGSKTVPLERIVTVTLLNSLN